MEANLSKKDIIHLLRGVEPSYDKMGIVEDMGLGYYTGGFEDRFEWQYPNDHIWNKYSEEELYKLYNKQHYKQIRRFFMY